MTPRRTIPRVYRLAPGAVDLTRDIGRATRYSPTARLKEVTRKLKQIERRGA